MQTSSILGEAPSSASRYTHAASSSETAVFRGYEIPADHNEHKIRREWWSLTNLKQHEVPAEGPSIIYEVPKASTARVRGIDPLGMLNSKRFR